MGKGLWSALFVCLATVLAWSPVYARGRERTIHEFLHTAWTARDGAPPEIWALDQAPDGFLWLGTGSGLYRFDGIGFERFRPAPGERLASIDITAVKILASNEMWIGYSDGGVSRLKDGHVTTFLERDGIWPGMVVRFVQDGDGVLWAVSHGGLSRFKSGHWRKLGADWNIPAGVIVELFLARDGTLWLSSAQTIHFLRPAARRFEPTGALTQHATFAQTPDGRIWVADALHGLRPLPDYPSGDSQGPWRLKTAVTGNVLSVPNFAVDRHGVIWATDRLNGGIFRFDPLEAKHASQSLLPSDIKDVFRRADGLTADRSIPILSDREGNIWVGTNAGLNRFRGADIIPDAALPAATAFGYSIAATPDATYITEGEWLYRALPNETARRFARLPPARTILFRASGGALWYANSGFMHRVQGNELVRIAPPEAVVDDNVSTIAEDGAGALWVTFERTGVFLLKGDEWFGKVDLGELPTPAVAQSDPAGTGAIWLGFSGSRVSRHDATGTRVFSERDGLEVGGVEAITIRDGAVWVGGEFGVALLDKERFRTIGPERMEPLFGISGIEQTADGHLLFNGLLGVVRVNAEEMKKAFADPSYSPVHDLYDRSDGMPGVAQQGSHAPTIVTGADGRIWFISNTGVAVLAADGSERNLLAPPVTILSATAAGVPYSTAGQLALPTGASSLTITYAAGSLSVPARVRFRYKLENLDSDWVDAGRRREAVYNNLGPGQYRFRVIAANEDGVWNMDGATLAIEIPPTFVQSWPFRLLCAITVVGLLWLAYSMRLQAVADRIRMRMAERMEERERIARELHDTLLQSVQTLTLRFQLVVDDLPKDAHARATLEEALDRADIVIAEGRDRVRDLRTQRDRDIERTVADIIKRQAFDSRVEITMTTTGTRRALEPGVLDEATRIASEAIFNIWRHARANRVAIEIGHGANFSMRIADNGVGIPREVADRGQKEGHFGLAGMGERARNLRGGLVIRPLPEAGTEVVLTVPGQIAYKAVERHVSL
jgi:signal transduction histidine kinase/ligand-binding sensor domain-containing protein